MSAPAGRARVPPRSAAQAEPVFGWDVGGAHVKVCVADLDGNVHDVAQWACPLWQGLTHLTRVIGLVLDRWPAARGARAVHAVTMTGEMVDLFGDREEGVRALTQALGAALGPRLQVFAGAEGWLGVADCADAWRDVASANWLATAGWVATQLSDAVLVDIGSTTTDIVPIAGGRVAALGCNDAERLASGELAYHGVIRTPLCAIASRIRLGVRTYDVVNEWFATTADVYRLTGELDPSCDQYPSADNGPKTPAASRRRLARMIGMDARDASDEAWQRFAERWRAAQLRRIGISLERVCAVHRAGDERAHVPIVGAGCGRFVARALAAERALRYVDLGEFGALAGLPRERRQWAASCAPSVAVALLLGRQLSGAPMESEAE
jgi:probable H4MPT-linked C1 transfer pathway protein